MAMERSQWKQVVALVRALTFKTNRRHAHTDNVSRVAKQNNAQMGNERTKNRNHSGLQLGRYPCKYELRYSQPKLPACVRRNAGARPAVKALRLYVKT